MSDVYSSTATMGKQSQLITGNCIGWSLDGRMDRWRTLPDCLRLAKFAFGCYSVMEAALFFDRPKAKLCLCWRTSGTKKIKRKRKSGQKNVFFLF